MLTSSRASGASLLHHWLALLRIPNVRRLAATRLLINVYFYSALIVRFEMSRGLNFTQIFLLESVLSLSIWLLDIPTGVWADRLGYRRLLLIGRTLNAASVLVMLLAHGFLQFSAGDVLFGAGIACASGCEDALLLQSLAQAAGPERASETASESASAFALLGACSSAGFFVGLASGSLFAARAPVIAVAATLVPATLAIAVTWRLRTVASGEAATPATPAKPGEPDTLVAIEITGVRLLASAWRLIREQPALIGLSLAQSLSFVCVNAIFWYNQPLLGRAGVAARWFGPLTALAVACAVVTPLALPLARRWLSRRLCFALALMAPGVGYLALAQSHGAVSVVALLALVVGGSSWGAPLLSEALNERIPNAARATTLSALSFIGALAGMAANALVGRAGDAGLSLASYALGATLLALGCLAPWLMRRAPQQNVPAAPTP